MTRSINPGPPSSDARARIRLGLPDVVAAARGVLAEAGLDGLTMGAVAARLDVTPMALYRHVDGRAGLLAAVAGAVLEAVGTGVDPDAAWDDAVVAWMRDARRNIVQNPWAAQLIGTATQISPAWTVALDRLLAALERGPLDDDARADALVWVARTTIGVVLLEAKAPLAQAGPVNVPPEAAQRWARIDARLRTRLDDDLFEDLVRQTRRRLADAGGGCFEKHDERGIPGADDLTDAQWQAVRAVLPPTDPRGAAAADDRRVVDGIRYRERTGAAWRNVPPGYGSWQTLYGRCRRWTADGTWARVDAVLAGEA